MSTADLQTQEDGTQIQEAPAKKQRAPRKPKEPKEPQPKEEPKVVKTVTIPGTEAKPERFYHVYQGSNGGYFTYGKITPKGDKRRNYLSAKQVAKHELPVSERVVTTKRKRSDSAGSGPSKKAKTEEVASGEEAEEESGDGETDYSDSKLRGV